MKKPYFLYAVLLFLSTCAMAQMQSLKSGFDGYLFAYFEGSGERQEQEQLRFAVSENGINWVALNNNRPIIPSAEISQTGGIRDPYILRKADNSGFYMVATDMNVAKSGWGSNPGIVLMKSDSLLEWTSSIIDLAKLYPEKFGNVQWVWAPQTIYDAKAKKYLVYFTVKFKDDDKLDFYSAYANRDFTVFEKEPQLMFSPKFGGIDGDIINMDGKYHFFFRGYTKDANGVEIKNGIKQATSKSLKGPWKEGFKCLDAYADTSVVVEGSSVFKLNNSDEYILMYDLYANGRYEFQRSSDLFNFTEDPESFTKNFNPRHGSVIGITKDEARRLNEKWSGVPVSLLQPTESGDVYRFKSDGNPIIKHRHTADPAALVHDGVFYIYAGEDKGDGSWYNMPNWLVYSTTDMINWTEYPVPLERTDFSWAKDYSSWAAQVIERNGKFYWYVSTEHATIHGKAIGVAVSDSPTGPFKDARGSALITNNMTTQWTGISWDDIDPTVWIDDDGQAYLFWGNTQCYYAKLKDNMTELDGPIMPVSLPDFTEAPWIHKRGDWYYLSYASLWPEKTCYAMSKTINGPWEYKGILNELSGNCNTNHQAVVEYKGDWYFVYHNGGLFSGGSYLRSVCIDYLYYNDDGTLKRIQMTTEGVDKINE
ncbi:family 43 glycosylhydrolase [Saccharicrinis sp. FJH62]|uniref:family 43 glycosylhydrolase n=1 Tax=Saccharicrinis sp. FJH62 TaxID=3344657 RepID=UPI0035D4DA9A